MADEKQPTPKSKAPTKRTPSKRASKTAKKPVSSGPSSKPYLELKDEVRRLGISSRTDYMKHLAAYEPEGWPKYPNRAYSKVWVGWNDFLGTDNRFGGGPASYSLNFLPYSEAVIKVHQLKLPTAVSWHQYVHECGANWDRTLPKRPDLFYKAEWTGWADWLGNSTDTRLLAHQRAIEKSLAVFYVWHDPKIGPVNVFQFDVEVGGVSAVRNKINNDKIQVVASYWYNAEYEEQINTVIQQLTQEWIGHDRLRVSTNIHAVNWELCKYMDPVRI